MIKVSYDTKKFQFKEILSNLLNTVDLCQINETIEVLKRENDQNTIYHKMYYDWARTDEFVNLYQIFIREVVLPIYNKSIVYQSIPTFRVAFQNNIAVGEFHKDKWYRDISWAEKVSEDNFFLPFTDAFDTNTIWVETEEDKGDYFPMECKYGEIIKWNGSNLTHGNKINITGKTRISVDFRVIPYDRYEPSNHGSINMDSKFSIGGYYDLLEI
jgi:hypothetical protein